MQRSGHRRGLRIAGVAHRSNVINGLNVYPFHCPSRWVIHARKLLRPEKRGRRGARDRGTDGDSQAGCRILENAIKDGPVKVSFLGSGRLLRKVLASLCEHLIRDFILGMRHTNIDELPQLFNVLIGDMSLVGPRPHATSQNETFAQLISSFSRRHNVKPGITGWAQVHGYRGETDTLEKMQRRVEHDLYYIDNWSFLLDLKIIVMTLFSKKVYWNAF